MHGMEWPACYAGAGVEGLVACCVVLCASWSAACGCVQTQERKNATKPPKETMEELAEANKVFEDF